jgi:hypothetical protein
MTLIESDTATTLVTMPGFVAHDNRKRHRRCVPRSGKSPAHFRRGEKCVATPVHRRAAPRRLPAKRDGVALDTKSQARSRAEIEIKKNWACSMQFKICSRICQFFAGIFHFSEIDSIP